VAIDMPAGPSEVEVLADKSANPVFVAADLLSQAEHGVDSQSILVTVDEALVEPVLEQIEIQLEQLPRKDLAKKALENSKIIVLKTLEEAVELTNEYAPEHLIISTQYYMGVAANIVNAGSVFWEIIRRKAPAIMRREPITPCQPTVMPKHTMALISTVLYVR